MKRPLLIAFVLLCAASADAAPIRRAVAVPPPFPPCAMITGTPAVTFTRDQGATLAPTAEPLTGTGYTYGLAVLDAPGSLLAWHKNDLIASSDHGCSWRVIATFTDIEFPPRIEPAKGGRAYAWSDNRSFLVRYDARGAVKLKQPVAFVGFGVNKDSADIIRGAGADGSIWQSIDAGESWERIGGLRGDVDPIIYYRFAFDPADLDHIVAGTTIAGAYYTFDGGRNWRRSALGSGMSNVFNLVISPADAQVVWAMALDLVENDAALPSQGRHIYRSTDGGATFKPVVDQSPSVTLINGPVMAAHPTNPAVLYFVFGTYFQNYGTDLYRYDAASGMLTTTHNGYDGIDAIAFSRSQPNLMYLGLEVERSVR